MVYITREMVEMENVIGYYFCLWNYFVIGCLVV